MEDCAVSEQHLSPAPAQGVMSIMIPTYNRAGMLNETLKNIAAQLTGALADKVEVIVNSNASDDGTLDLLRAWAAKDLPFSFSYYQHAENMGSPAQLYYAPLRARCPWFIAFGDDDWFNTGGIERIVRALEEHQPAFITVNREVRECDMIKVTAPYLNTVADQHYATFKDLLDHFGVYQLGFWSGQVMRRDAMMAIDLDPYCDPKGRIGGFAQIMAYIEAYYDKPSMYMKDCVVIHRTNNFADVDAAVLNGFQLLGIDMVHLIEEFRARHPDWPDNFYESICGVKNLYELSVCPTRRLSDMVIEHLFRTMANGVRLRPQDFEVLHAALPHIRVENQAILGLCLELEHEIVTALADPTTTKQTLDGLNMRANIFGRSHYTHGAAAVLAVAYSRELAS
jgi:glycosyltransferase involved in cell wall biosynthesis